METKSVTAPRKYQEELLRLCIQQNTILYLPTGAGKTYIAVMLIKDLMRKSYVECGHQEKLALFIVNQVALAQQQAAYLSRHAELNVGYYIGIMNVDFWDRERWKEEFQKNEVLVMTSQIFCNIIIHNFIDIRKICVAVFDECHAATGNHPMKQALENILKLQSEARLLGLSGSLINGDCKLSRVVRSLKDLEEAFNGKIATPKDSLLPEVQRYSTNPDEEIHYYDGKVTDTLVTYICTKLTECQNFVMQSKLYKDTPKRQTILLGLCQQDDKMKQNKELKNILENVKHQLFDLGLYGCYEATRIYIAALHKMAKRGCTAEAVDVTTSIKETLNEVRNFVGDRMIATTKVSDRIRKFSSKKFLKFIALIERIFSNISNNKQPEPSVETNIQNILVFVNRRSTAKTLSEMLKSISESDDKLRDLNTDFVVGYGAQHSNEVTQRHKRANEDAIDRFRSRQLNLLVATDVLEEGIDIPICNTVIMFDTPTSHRSYIQSKGRARHKMSTYHLFVNCEDHKFLEKFKMYKSVGYEISRVVREGGTLLETVDVIQDNEEENETIEWHIPFGSYAILKGSYAIQLVYMYCNKLPRDKYTQLAPLWYIVRRNEKYVGFVQLPVNSILKGAVEGEPQMSRKFAKQSAALEALKKLHSFGELDDDMIPKAHGDIINYQKLFKHLSKEPNKTSLAQQGSKQRKQLYVKRCPVMFSDCKPQESQTTYLHIIRVQATDSRPVGESDYSLLYDLINKDEHFGILSSKEIPEVFKFPLYGMEVKLNVVLTRNDNTYTLSKEQIHYCEEFQQFIFKELLNIVKPFICIDSESREYSYLIVPTNRTQNGDLQIDWKTLHDAVLQKTMNNQKFSRSCVLSQQRSVGANQLYLVTDTGELHTSEALGRRLKGDLVEAVTIPNDLNWLQEKKLQKTGQCRRINVNPELCRLIFIPAALCLKAQLLPSILHKLCVLAGAYEIFLKIPISKNISGDSTKIYAKGDTNTHIRLLDTTLSESGITVNNIEQALTASSCDDTFNCEILETLGDSFLKFAVSLFLFIHYKNHHEGKLSCMKNEIVSNCHFHSIAKGNDLGNKVQVHRFSPEDMWIPPGFSVPKDVCRKFLCDCISPDLLEQLTLNGTEILTDALKGKQNTWDIRKQNNHELLIGVQTVSDKALADTLEALAGVYLKAYGLFGAVEFLNSFGVLPTEFASPAALFKTPPEKPLLHVSLPYQYVNLYLGSVEELEGTLKYKFKDRGFLLQALTHPSYADNRITECYQRLEFLGDAVLDFLVTSYLYEKCQNATPGKITLLRSALVNNSTFAAFSVRIGLQKYCKYRSSELFYSIDQFVRIQEENNHHITIKEVESDTVKPAAPKVLGDLFESVAAAVYLDSGKCLKTVWSIYSKIMARELEELM